MEKIYEKSCGKAYKRVEMVDEVEADLEEAYDDVKETEIEKA